MVMVFIVCHSETTVRLKGTKMKSGLMDVAKGHSRDEGNVRHTGNGFILTISGSQKNLRSATLLQEDKFGSHLHK